MALVLTSLVSELVHFVIESLLMILADLIPASVLGWVESAADGFASLMAFTPVTAVVLLMTIWIVVDTALQAYNFAVETYRLIPFI